MAARSLTRRPEICPVTGNLCPRSKVSMALLVASSELDEIVAVSDRVAVLRDRRKVGEIGGDDVTRDNIIHMIAGG